MKRVSSIPFWVLLGTLSLVIVACGSDETKQSRRPFVKVVGSSGSSSDTSSPDTNNSTPTTGATNTTPTVSTDTTVNSWPIVTALQMALPGRVTAGTETLGSVTGYVVRVDGEFNLTVRINGAYPDTYDLSTVTVNRGDRIGCYWCYPEAYWFEYVAGDPTPQVSPKPTCP